jgi:hypothetical protein
MPSGGYLRTNFRRTGQQQVTAIGGGIPLTSWIGTGILGQSGQALRQPYGGFIMGSIINTGGQITGLTTYGYSLSDANISAVVAVSAYGAMSAWYGAGVYNSGYVIMPFAITPKNLNTSDVKCLNLTWSTMASTAGITYPFGPSVFMIIPMGSAVAVCCSQSVNCIWAGWVISSP